MKLVELLATKLDKWADTTVCYVQDPDGCVWPCKEIAYRDCGQWGGDNGLIDQSHKAKHFEKVDTCDDHEMAIVTKEQWKAERDRQKGVKWKRHRGGKCPVKAGTEVITRYRDGVVSDWCMTRDPLSSKQELDAIWSHSGGSADIMAYKIEPQDNEEISQPTAEEVDMRLFNHEVSMDSQQGEIIHGPIKMGATVIAPAHPKWHEDQIDGPIKWRDTVIELDAYIEELTREREALINRLTLEGFALLPAMHPVMGVSDISFPIEEWQIGDIVEVVSTSDDSSAPLGVFEITDIDSHEPKYELDDTYFPNHDQMKFIRRP